MRKKILMLCGHHVPLNASFAEVNTANYDGLLIPGGRGAEYLRLNARVIVITHEFAEAGKPIAAVCHGAQLLAACMGRMNLLPFSAGTSCNGGMTACGLHIQSHRRCMHIPHPRRAMHDAEHVAFRLQFFAYLVLLKRAVPH